MRKATFEMTKLCVAWKRRLRQQNAHSAFQNYDIGLRFLCVVSRKESPAIQMRHAVDTVQCKTAPTLIDEIRGDGFIMSGGVLSVRK
jgi:hypothetical protein